MTFHKVDPDSAFQIASEKWRVIIDSVVSTLKRGGDFYFSPQSLAKIFGVDRHHLTKQMLFSGDISPKRPFGWEFLPELNGHPDRYVFTLNDQTESHFLGDELVELLPTE